MMLQRPSIRKPSVVDASMSKTRFCLSICFNLLCLITVYGVYNTTGYFSDIRYLSWAESIQTTNDLNLPDVVQDFLPLSWNSPDSPISRILDFPPMIVVIAFLATLLGMHTDLFNFLAFSQVLIMAGKGIVEHATIMPSSKGYSRCVNYLGITGTPASEHFAYQLYGLSGTCCGQMYSAHTATTMLGTFVLFCVLERKWPKTWMRAVGSAEGGVSLKFVMTLVVGIVEGALLITNFGHYTSDVLVAIGLVLLIVTNDKLALLFSRLNPALRRDDFAIRLDYDSESPKFFARDQPAIAL